MEKNKRIIFITFTILLLSTMYYFIKISFEKFKNKSYSFDLIDIDDNNLTINESKKAKDELNVFLETFDSPSIGNVTNTYSNTNTTPDLQSNQTNGNRSGNNFNGSRLNCIGTSCNNYTRINNSSILYPKDGFKIQDPNTGRFLAIVNNTFDEIINKSSAPEFKVIIDDINIPDKDSIAIQNITNNKFIRYKNGIITEDEFIANNPDFQWILKTKGKDIYVIYSKYYNKYISFNGINVILSDQYTLWKIKIFPDIQFDVSSDNLEYFSNNETFELITNQIPIQTTNKKISINIQ